MVFLFTELTGTKQNCMYNKIKGLVNTNMNNCDASLWNYFSWILRGHLDITSFLIMLNIIALYYNIQHCGKVSDYSLSSLIIYGSQHLEKKSNGQHNEEIKPVLFFRLKLGENQFMSTMIKNYAQMHRFTVSKTERKIKSKACSHVCCIAQDQILSHI